MLNIVRNVNIIKEIGKELRRIREEKGTPLTEIAEKSGVSTMYISEIERNKKSPSDEMVEKLSNIYGVDEVDLYEGFKKIPKSMEEEILRNSTLFVLLFNLSTNTDISYDEKDRFYVKMQAEYDNIM